MVVLEAQVPKAFSNSFKSGALGLLPERIVGVSSINDFTKQYQCKITGKIVFFQYCLERALFAVVPQFHAFYVEWGGTESLGFVSDFAARDKEKFSLSIHKLLYKPRTSYAIYFHSFSGNPFHILSAPQVDGSLACWSVSNSEEFLRISSGMFPQFKPYTDSSDSWRSSETDKKSGGLLDADIAPCNTCNVTLII